MNRRKKKWNDPVKEVLEWMGFAFPEAELQEKAAKLPPFIQETLITKIYCSVSTCLMPIFGFSVVLFGSAE